MIIHDGLIFGSGWYEPGPDKSDAPSYTKAFVQQATNLYDAVGLEETLAYHNREESIDGQWYVFVIDENDLVIGHPDPKRLGLDLKGWVGTDANGYNFGPDMLSATGDGKWVSYVYRNPESGGLGIDFDHLELKNVWVVRHDGLLFASGWYIDADEFTKSLVATAARVFREVGLEGTIAYFASPEIAFGGLAAVITYYNSAENVEGYWFAFIADENGTIIDHYDKAMVGRDIKDLLGTDTFEATAEGNWVTTEVPAGLGGRPGRDDLRLGLAQRSRRIGELRPGRRLPFGVLQANFRRGDIRLGFDRPIDGARSRDALYPDGPRTGVSRAKGVRVTTRP